MSRTIIKLKNDNYEDIRIDNRSMQRDMITGILSNTLSTTAGSYTLIPFDNSLTVGNKLTLEDGKVKIGAGVSKIKLSGQICTYNIGAGNAKSIKIGLYRDGVDNQLSQFSSDSDSNRNIFSIPDCIIEVQENDLISLEYHSSSVDVIWNGSYSKDEFPFYRTFITCEVIE